MGKGIAWVHHRGPRNQTPEPPYSRERPEGWMDDCQYWLESGVAGIYFGISERQVLTDLRP